MLIIKRIILILNILTSIIILPVYASLSVNPVNLPLNRVENTSYVLDFNTLSAEHAITYCTEGVTAAGNYYYQLVLTNGVTWGEQLNSTSINSSADVSVTRISGGSQDDDSVKFLIQSKSKSIPNGTCFSLLGKDIVLNIPQATLGEEFLIEAFFEEASINDFVNPAETASLVKIIGFCASVTEIPQNECETLRELYSTAGGNNWLDNSNWNLTNTPCDWAGITCNLNNSYITAIELSNNNLIGTIPDLSPLTNLQTLDLSNNQLTGKILELNELTNLKFLKLNNNSLSSNIPDIGQLAELQTVWLQNNKLEGNIPASIQKLTNLTDLDLGYNKLTADTAVQKFVTSKDSDWNTTQTIPPTNITATAKSPTSVEIKWTPIIYNLDTGYYQIKNSANNVLATTDNKNDNNITISDLSPATTYRLTITTVTKPHDNQKNELISTSKEFTVSTPALPALPKIQLTDFANNIIVDGSNFDFGEVILGNSITRTFTVKNIGDTSVKLQQLAVKGDDVFSTVFEPVTINKDETANFTISLDATSINTFAGEVSFRFDNNLYNFFITGKVITDRVDATNCATVDIPASECQTLLSLYVATDGKNWSLNDKWNKTNNPCGWAGITCDLNNIYIMAIELSNNNLIGTIPDLSPLANLQTLDLSFNQLSGSIPNLNSNIIKLKLNNNQLNNIPTSFTNLINLTELDLGYNKLTNSTNLLLNSLDSDWDTTQTVPPNNVTVTNVSPTTVALQWTAITYQFATGSYIIRYGTKQGGPYDKIKKIMVVNNNPATKYEEEIANLAPNTNYYFVVETNTNSDNPIATSIPSPEVSATTLSDVFSNPEPNSLLDIGSSELGTPSTTANITILRPDIKITDISILNNADFSVSTASNILTIQCTPTKIGIREGTLEIGYLVREVARKAQYLLTCTGINPKILYDSNPKPNSIIDIGTSKLATTITTTLTIFNYKGLEISNYQLVGEHVGDFIIGNLVQKADSNYELTLQCRPNAEGERKAYLNITTNASVQNIVTYELKCTGEVGRPIYNSEPPPNTILTMSAIVGNLTTTSIIIYNTGNEILGITGIVVSDNEIFQIDTTPFTVNNGTYTLPVRCKPINQGKYVATLVLTTNTQEQITYKLECTGIAEKIWPIYHSEPEPNSIIDVGNSALGTPVTTTIIISKLGIETLNIISNRINGSNVFNIIEGAAPFTIIDDVHTLVVQCTPIEVAKYTAELILETNDPDNKLVTYNLQCGGIEDFSATGEIQVQGGIFGNDISIDAPERFKLVGYIHPSQQHINQLADIIAIYNWKPSTNESLITIPVTVSHQIQLQAEIEMVLFEGNITNMTGVFEVELGYQTNANERFIGNIAKLEVKPNHPPTAITLTIDEAGNDLIGTFFTTDLDKGEQFIYSLVNPSSYFRIVDDKLHITNFMPEFTDIRIINDKSLENAYPITIQTTDTSGTYVREEFIIQIIPVIKSPKIRLTRKSVLENNQGIVGRVWSDVADYELKLLENDYFWLDDNGILRVKQPLDFETSTSYEITIQGAETFTIDVINVPDVTVHGKIFDNIQDVISVTIDDLAAVKIQFIPDIDHRSQEADVIAVAAYTVDEQVKFFVLANDIWQEWDRFTLPALTRLVLEAEHEIALFQSAQFAAGELQVYMGYRLDSGELVYDPKPVEIEIH